MTVKPGDVYKALNPNSDDRINPKYAKKIFSLFSEQNKDILGYIIGSKLADRRVSSICYAEDEDGSRIHLIQYEHEQYIGTEVKKIKNIKKLKEDLIEYAKGCNLKDDDLKFAISIINKKLP